MKIQSTVPKLLTAQLENGFKLIFEEHYQCAILDEGKIYTYVADLLKPLINLDFENDYRSHQIIGHCPFLVAIFFRDREIRLYSPKLSSELFFIHNENFQKNSKEYKIYFEHTQKVASLDINKVAPEILTSTRLYKNKDILNDSDYLQLEKELEHKSMPLVSHMNNYKSSFIEKISDWGLSLVAHYALIRVHLLKFLVILPTLDHDEGVEIKRNLHESLLRTIKDSQKSEQKKIRGEFRAIGKGPLLLIKFIYYFQLIMPAKLLAKMIRFSVRVMAKRFIAGESIEKATKNISDLQASGRDVTLDQLGELVVSEEEADVYMNKVLELINGFSLHYKKGDKNLAGINKAHVSIKVSALCSDFRPEAFDLTYKLVSPRLIKIFEQAQKEDVFINIDAEHYHYRDLVFKIYKKVLLETKSLKDYQATGIVLQAYLRDSSEHLNEIAKLANERKIQMPIRLVKGAYWDAETVEAQAHSFNAPEYLNKEETDLNFRQLIYKIYDNDNALKLCIASHNFSDHIFAETLKDKFYPQISPIEHQCLHMTYEALSVGMAKMNWAVRNYIPIGNLIDGMAYLVRRIMENSSQVGVLTIMRSHKKSKLLKTPFQVYSENLQLGSFDRDFMQKDLNDQFHNITINRPYVEKEMKIISLEFNKFKSENLGKDYGCSHPLTGEKKSFYCPSDLNLLVGTKQFASSNDVKKYIDLSDETYHNGKWAKSSFETRSFILSDVAKIIISKRVYLASLIVYEAGKTILEALADVDEAVDFLNFYAREEKKIHKYHQDTQSRGVVAVISPWNFPLAIPCGMIAAPIVAGNTVILKSSEKTPLIAQELVNIFYQANLPKDVLIHLPGDGKTVGSELVNSEKVSTVVFTGSREVGTMIYKNVTKRVYHNRLFDTKFPCKAITEMGGKNAIIVTENADLDEVVECVIYSGFAHSGQKCSALSRIIVSSKIKNNLVKRLKNALLDLKVGRSDNFETFMNPLISIDEKERFIRQVKEASLEARSCGGKIHVDRSQENLPGACVGPVLIELPKQRSYSAESFFQKELFAPFIHIVSASDIDEAISLFNCTEYALTGGIFSQSEDEVEYILGKLECGNIYVNRTITGARVGIEPFGGFKFSGTGPKAGGRHYVSAFHIHSSLSEDYLEAKEGVEDAQTEKIELSHEFRGSVSWRSEKIIHLGLEVLTKFETLYGGIYSKEREEVVGLYGYLKKHLEKYLSCAHFNRLIPGQLSYNNYEHSFKKVLVVSFSKLPPPEILFYTLSAMACGAGVSVICRNQESYSWWMIFKDLTRWAGISNENFNAFFVGEKDCEHLLHSKTLEAVIYDGSLAEYEKMAALIYKKSGKSSLAKIFSQYDAPKISDYKSYLRSFVKVRSYAINVMRHGASMETRL